MSVLHAFFAKSHHQRHLRSKLVDLRLYDLSDLVNLRLILFFEVPDNVIVGSEGVIDELLAKFSIKSFPRSKFPDLDVAEPFVRSDPEVAIGLKVLNHLSDLGIVCLLEFKQVFL
jgi:hypothetical protein